MPNNGKFKFSKLKRANYSSWSVFRGLLSPQRQMLVQFRHTDASANLLPFVDRHVCQACKNILRYMQCVLRSFLYPERSPSELQKRSTVPSPILHERGTHTHRYHHLKGVTEIGSPFLKTSPLTPISLGYNVNK